MHFAIALFALPFLGPSPGHFQRLHLAQRHLDREGEKDSVSEVVWARRMVLRRRALDKRTVSAVVGMKVVLGMLRWSKLFEGRRNLLAGQELLIPQGYECERVDYL